jgi:hypothetical protein
VLELRTPDKLSLQPELQFTVGRKWDEVNVAENPCASDEVKFKYDVNG